jgi:hypothetical protein
VFTAPGKPQAGIITFVGLAIHIHDSKTPEWGDAVKTLWEALLAEGIEAKALRITDNTENDAAIHIKIGRKP